jgi:hypothetical protein
MYRIPEVDRTDYLKPCTFMAYYAVRRERCSALGLVPSLTVMRVSAPHSVHARLGYRDVTVMQKALGSFMGQDVDDGSGMLSPAPDAAGGAVVGNSGGVQQQSRAPATTTAASSVPPATKSASVADSKALSMLMSAAFSSIDVVVTNDVGGIELPLAALRMEHVHASTISWHNPQRMIAVAGS